MYRKKVIATYESPFGFNFALPTLAQVVSICINQEDRFVIEMDNEVYDFMYDNDDYWTGWTVEKLAKALLENNFCGGERVYSLSLAFDKDKDPYYIIRIQTDDNC